jgi:hypothetical protein
MAAMWRSSRVSACRRGPSSHEKASPPQTAAFWEQSRDMRAQQATVAGVVGLLSEPLRRLLRPKVACLAHPLASLSVPPGRISAVACHQPFAAVAPSRAHENRLAISTAAMSSLGQVSLALRWCRCQPVGRPL